MMEAIGVIPARYSSTRFEGKVIADLLGKPVVQHVWEQAKKCKSLNDLIVATDDQRVVDVVEAFGGKVMLTSVDQPSGTDRLAEVVNPMDVKIVINIQGDEPLVQPAMIDELVRALSEDETICMATIIKRINKKDELIDPNIVKVVIDRFRNALYFSRSPIPFEKGEPAKLFYKHMGLYAYTKDFLFTFTHLPKSNLETAESLEQLRALENNYKIKTIETEFDTVGIDTPEDLKRAERVLRGEDPDPEPEEIQEQEVETQNIEPDNVEQEVTEPDNVEPEIIKSDVESNVMEIQDTQREEQEHYEEPENRQD